MTDAQLIKSAKRIMNNIENAMAKDVEITLAGNGCNAFECHSCAKEYLKLIEQYILEKK